MGEAEESVGVVPVWLYSGIVVTENSVLHFEVFSNYVKKSFHILGADYNTSEQSKEEELLAGVKTSRAPILIWIDFVEY